MFIPVHAEKSWSVRQRNALYRKSPIVSEKGVYFSILSKTVLREILL